MEIYLDNSATTKPYKEVVDVMVLALTDEFGNPSSAHKKGFEVEKKIKKIRENIASTLCVSDKNIVFTSGGTECNNSIIRSVAYSNRNKNHIITSSIEHPSVLKTLESLKNEGFEVTYLNVNEKGIIDLEQLKEAITPKTALVSVMYVNNEIGSVQPIKEIEEILKDHKDIFFHVDAVQGYGKVNFKLNNRRIDFISVSAHKIHGPKGIGFMYIKDINKFKPLLIGGGQESSLRSGTENIPGIYGMGKAIEILFSDLDNNIEKIKKNRDLLKNLITEKVEDIKINSSDEGVCHILNISFKGVKGEALLHYLSDEGISVSIGSACSSKKKGSHVLQEIKLSNEEIEGAIRFSLSDLNTEEEIIYAAEKVKTFVDQIRVFSSIKRRK